MTDAELVAKKLAAIETYVREPRDLVGFRNVLVHGYATVDLGVVEDVVAHHLDDLLAFVSVVRRRIAQ